jgi:hypothetical protein
MTHFRPFMPPMLLPESGRPFMSLFARFLGYEPVAKSSLKWDKAVIPEFRPEGQVLPRADIQRLLNRPPAAAATGPFAD